MIRSIVRPSAESTTDPRLLAEGEQPAFDGSSDTTLATLFQGAFRGRIEDDETFRCWSFASERDARVVLELADRDRERVVWFEAGLHRAPEHGGGELKPAVPEAVAVLSEFLHEILDQYLAEERSPAPQPDFFPHEREGTTLYLRGQAANEKLERMADEWLARYGADPGDPISGDGRA